MKTAYLAAAFVTLGIVLVIIPGRDSTAPSELRRAIVRHEESSRRDSTVVAHHVANAKRAGEKSAEAAARASRLREQITTAPPGAELLVSANALLDTALVYATARGDALDSALVVSELHASRADSLLVRVMDTREPEHCTIVRFIPCPGRRAIVIAAAGALLLTRRR